MTKQTPPFNAMEDLLLYVNTVPPTMHWGAYTLSVSAIYTESENRKSIREVGALTVICRSKTGEPFAWSIVGDSTPRGRFGSEAAALQAMRNHLTTGDAND